MEMYLCLLLLLPVSQGLQSSHVQVTIGGSSYSHGNKHELPHPPSAYTPLPPPPPAYTPQPPPPPAYTPQPHPTPAPYVPLVQHPAHVSVLPLAPVHHPVVHHAPVHQPNYHTPLYAAHAAPYPHDSRYMPQQNCTVTEDLVTAEICIPTLKAMCTQESLMIKRIVDKEICQDVTRTVCTDSSVEVPSTVCTYMYKTEEMMASAKIIEISFEKMCTTQMVTVCEPGHSGYGYNAHCKEVNQETCYNKPMVMPMEEMVTVSYPVPMMDCMEKKILLPTVSCQDIVEKRCFMIPDVMDDTILVEKCSVEIYEPSCQQVKLSLPTQTCRDIVYGAAYHSA